MGTLWVRNSLVDFFFFVERVWQKFFGVLGVKKNEFSRFHCQLLDFFKFSCSLIGSF